MLLACGFVAGLIMGHLLTIGQHQLLLRHFGRCPSEEN